MTPTNTSSATTLTTLQNWPANTDPRTWVAQLADALLSRQWQLCTAESCTGGLIAAACTDVAGSSRWFERGFVTYSNAAKAQNLGVPLDLIATHGAVSAPVAIAMAQGAARAAQAAVSVAVTGIAGPDGGCPAKPVGTVHFGCSVAGQSHHSHQCFAGDRHAVRDQSARFALWWTLQCVLATR